MRDEHYWPTWDSDTGEFPAVRDADPADDTYQIDPEDPEEAAADDGELVDELLEGDDAVDLPLTPARRFRKGVGKVLMITGGVIALLVVVYAADLMINAGDVPRGVTVAGVEVGGMSRKGAEAKLRQELEPRLIRPIQVRAGDVQAELTPSDSGLGLDWPGTVEQAGRQPLNPVTRVMSFFTTREVGVATSTEPKTLAQAVTRLAETRLNHPPVEGSIGFVPIAGSDGGVTAYPVEPRQGQTLNDVDRAAEILKADWIERGGIELPVDLTPVKATSAGVHAALDRIVVPAVAGPVVVHGEGKDAVLKPAAIGGAFQFSALDNGALEVKLDQSRLQQDLQPQLVSTEKEGKDAQIVFDDGRPTVTPSEDGRKVSWVDTFKPFMEVMTKPDGRELKVAYQVKKPETTTDEANALGIKEVVGEFSTGGFSGDVATNVRAIAGQVSGAIVKPGETFSLDGRTGPRTASGGYASAPVNEDGTGPKVIGGGVSQFTSTLYNAAYFAGLKDAGHTEHSYYLDRYPAGRDAKSLQDNGSTVDMKFTNDAPTGVAVQASASGSTVTVKIWGTKRFRVDSSTSGQSETIPPGLEPGPPEGCQPSSGSPGFSISDTRVLYDLASGGEVRRETRSVTYQPRPTIICF
ncbi:VanW family protein [Amycolatopsis nigrescens]|uniref:VanW family protein n=1 Tax=Amycolatopsis nigrescens TaxID=381445 RepID=UPI00037D91AB|nr:VanW family protein [Amycolatopsis nigrescens]